jgi:hypothetical protein
MLHKQAYHWRELDRGWHKALTWNNGNTTTSKKPVCDFVTPGLSLSNKGPIGKPAAFSWSPCRKNSSSRQWTHLYNARTHACCKYKERLVSRGEVSKTQRRCILERGFLGWRQVKGDLQGLTSKLCFCEIRITIKKTVGISIYKGA